MINSVDLLGNTHIIEKCTLDDVEQHLSKILTVVERDSGIKEFISKMTKAVNNRTAFKIVKYNCFLYYLNTEKRCADGIALYNENSPLAVMALFSGIFTDIDTDTIKINFHLHKGKYTKEYKSLVTVSSIRRQIIPNYPLIIRVDKLKTHINRIMDHG